MTIESADLPLRTWRVGIKSGKRGEFAFLGTVEAPDREAAVAAAVKAFNLTDEEQRKRLVVQEQRVKAR
jgi:1,2-phenylacetyl-CoA epoxidase PaaB subunit